MGKPEWSRRRLLKTTATIAAGALFAEPVRAAPPPPSSVTPELIAAARKEGKVSYYSALELNVAEKLGKVLPSTSNAPGPSGFISASRRSSRDSQVRNCAP